MTMRPQLPTERKVEPQKVDPSADTCSLGLTGEYMKEYHKRMAESITGGSRRSALMRPGSMMTGLAAGPGTLEENLEYMRELMDKGPDAVYFQPLDSQRVISSPRRNGKSHFNEFVKKMMYAKAYGGDPSKMALEYFMGFESSMTMEEFRKQYLCEHTSPSPRVNILKGRTPPEDFMDDPRYVYASTREEAQAIKAAYMADKNPCGEIVINIEKDNKMASINVNTLVALSQVNAAADEYSKYDELPEGLKKALKKKLEAQQEQKIDAAADAVVQVLNSIEEGIQGRVDRIRKLRRDVDALRAEVQQMERARAFGMSTQNFLPALETIGYAVPLGAGLSAIPADFKVKK